MGVLSWMVAASPLAALLITPTVDNEGKTELEFKAYVAITIFALLATSVATHLLESFFIDLSGTLFVAVASTAPFWSAPAFAQATTKILALATTLGVDVKILAIGPSAWNPIEHVFFAVAVLVCLLVLDLVVALLFAPAGPMSSVVNYDTKAQVFAVVNRLVFLVATRHTLEFALPARQACTDGFCIPHSVRQLFVAPDTGDITVTNSVGALVACILVCDLFLYSVRRFVLQKPCDASAGAIGANPLEYAVYSYMHLLAVVIVALSPVGIHSYTVVLFWLTTTMLMSIFKSRGLGVGWIPFFYSAADHEVEDTDSNYSTYLTLWDYLCNTYTAGQIVDRDVSVQFPGRGVH